MRALILLALLACSDPSPTTDGGVPRCIWQRCVVGKYDVLVYSTGGARLDKGDTVTGSAVNDVYLINGIVKYYPAPEAGPHGTLARWDGSAYTATLGSQGDGTYFGTGTNAAPDRITVVSATIDEVELSVEWDAWDLGSPGIGYRDWVGAGGLNYEEGAVSPNWKYITETRLVKTVIMRRGREGVFLGYHTDPRVGPLDTQIPSYNNATDWGEREFQCSGGAVTAVSFSSAGVSCIHPDFGSDDDWGAGNYATTRHCWLGIDDANYPPYDQAAFIARQHASFPSEQSTGPWWVAALHNANATTHPFCTYLVLREKLEVGAFQFSAGAYGQITAHFVNEAHDAGNIPYRSMVFLGAFPYTSADLSSEPTSALKAMVANRAHSTDFELSGQADLGVELTTIAQVRDRMITQLEDATATVMANRKFRHHREDIEFTDFCEKNPHAAFRLFSIRDSFPDTTLIHTPDLREIHTVVEVVVAYPKTGNYRQSGTPRPLLDLDDTMRADLWTLRRKVGLLGYAQLETDGVNAAVTDEQVTKERGVGCDYLVLRLPIMYREDPL